jgi:hypothetical protein
MENGGNNTKATLSLVSSGCVLWGSQLPGKKSNTPKGVP